MPKKREPTPRPIPEANSHATASRRPPSEAQEKRSPVGSPSSEKNPKAVAKNGDQAEARGPILANPKPLLTTQDEEEVHAILTKVFDPSAPPTESIGKLFRYISLMCHQFNTVCDSGLPEPKLRGAIYMRMIGHYDLVAIKRTVEIIEPEIRVEQASELAKLPFRLPPFTRENAIFQHVWKCMPILFMLKNPKDQKHFNWWPPAPIQAENHFAQHEILRNNRAKIEALQEPGEHPKPWAEIIAELGLSDPIWSLKKEIEAGGEWHDHIASLGMRNAQGKRRRRFNAHYKILPKIFLKRSLKGRMEVKDHMTRDGAKPEPMDEAKAEAVAAHAQEIESMTPNDGHLRAGLVEEIANCIKTITKRPSPKR